MLIDDKYIEYEKCEKLAKKRVIAKFHQEIIKSNLAELGKNPVIPVLDNLRGEYNIPRIIRTANIFACREVFIVGEKFFNPYPAVGAVRATRIRFFDTIEPALDELRSLGFEIFAMLPPKYGGKSVFQTSFKQKGTAFIVGHETKGISFNIEKQKDVKPLHIPQQGKIESLNVSIALSIAVAEWMRQHVFIDK